MRWSNGWGLAASAVAVSLFAVPLVAEARVRLEGQWPDADKPVTLEMSEVPRAQALRRLADAAGWSLVVHGPAAEPVDVHVTGQPASKVLALLLGDGNYVARRDGSLVAIERDTTLEGDASGTAASGPRADASGAETHERARDRTVMGGGARILKDETVRDVTVFGGNLEVAGDVIGDVSVFGGDVQVAPGAHIKGDATVFGGRLTLASGCRVEGDVSAIGGGLERAPGAEVGGSVDRAEEGEDDDGPTGNERRPSPGLGARIVGSLTDSLRLAAVLYVIGTLLLALAGARMTTMRVEMAARPIRSMALGLVGSVTFLVVLVALCVTIIGIPVAIVALLVSIFAVAGAMGAVLSVAGEALLRHKTENPYVHLAVGCALLVAVSWVPWVGGLAVVAVVLSAGGVLVATRCAALIPGKLNSG